MSGVAIYMEGGGKGKESQSALRQGMDGFLRRLKDAARAKQWRWKLVCCGPRGDALRGFQNAVARGDDTVTVLLVDDARRTSMTRRLTAIIEREGDGYVSLCPELDVASQGATVNEARDNLREALALFFETASPAEVERRFRHDGENGGEFRRPDGSA